MQYMNLNKILEMENEIKELLIISIDDQIETIEDEEGIKLLGNIKVGGKLKTSSGEETFDESIDLDIFLTIDEVEDRNNLNVEVNDFNYKIDNNKLILDISLKIDGLKEIETTFLSEENIEPIEEEKEIEEDKKVYIDVDIDISERNSLEETEYAVGNENFVEEDKKSESIEGQKKSLLKTIFSSKKINEEVSWKLHCVKNEKSYEEIATMYNVNLNKLVSLNKNEELSEGKLIFLPLE